MASTQKRIRRARKVQRKPPEEKGGDQVSKEERIERSLERDGYAVTVREAKLYYTAFRLAYDANGDVNNPAERWKLGDEFIAEHKGGDEEDAFKTPPRKTSPEHYDWLAMWQTGSSLPEILKFDCQRRKVGLREDPNHHTTIHKGITAAASQIGLTRRRGKRGRPKSKY